MSSVSLAAVVLAVSLCQSSAFFPHPFGRPLVGRPTVPRCPASSKPCRIKAELSGGTSGGPAADLLSVMPEVISSEPCSCPDSKACSDDWQTNRDRVIVRELLTDDNITMTLSMMFCSRVQAQELCRNGEVALQLVGHSILPTEVDFINCACADPNPLIVHQKSIGADHRHYHAYVCPDQKRYCNIGWRRRDTCMVFDPRSHTTDYPCRCPRGSTCREPPYNTFTQDYTCRRGRRSRSG